MEWTQSDIDKATNFARAFMRRRFGRDSINAMSAEDFVMSLVASGFSGQWRMALPLDMIDAYRNERGRTYRNGKREIIGRKFGRLRSDLRSRPREVAGLEVAISSMGLSSEKQKIIHWLLAGDQQRWIAMRLGISEARVSQLRQEIEAHLSQHSLWRDLVARHGKRKRKQVESKP